MHYNVIHLRELVHMTATLEAPLQSRVSEYRQDLRSLSCTEHCKVAIDTPPPGAYLMEL